MDARDANEMNEHNRYGLTTVLIGITILALLSVIYLAELADPDSRKDLTDSVQDFRCPPVLDERNSRVVTSIDVRELQE